VGSVRPVPIPAVTEERLRFVQGVTAVFVIGGFVFEIRWIAPALTALLVAALALGPGADLLAWPFDRWFASRVRAATPVSDSTVRAVTLTSAIGLGAAIVVGAAGGVGVAELLALIVGGIAALYATTGIVVAQAFTSARAERARRTRRRAPRPGRTPRRSSPPDGGSQRS